LFHKNTVPVVWQTKKPLKFFFIPLAASRCHSFFASLVKFNLFFCQLHILFVRESYDFNNKANAKELS